MKSKYFVRKEFACECKCGFNTVDTELLEVLEDIREHFDKPVVINSACRCIKHNKEIGGKPSSKHLLGQAADIRVSSINSKEVQKYVLKKYPSTYGIGCYDTFTHIDVREGKARW